MRGGERGVFSLLLAGETAAQPSPSLVERRERGVSLSVYVLRERHKQRDKKMQTTSLRASAAVVSWYQLKTGLYHYLAQCSKKYYYGQLLTF